MNDFSKEIDELAAIEPNGKCRFAVIPDGIVSK